MHIHHPTVWKYYVLRMLPTIAVNFHATSYVVFLLSLDLSLSEVTLVNFSFMLTSALCQTPTGIFADTYGRKKSMYYGFFISAIGYYVYSVATGLMSAVLAEVVIGIGMAFISGADDAWLNSEHSARPSYSINGSMTKIFSHAEFMTRIAGASVGAYGAVVAQQYDFRMPMTIGVCVALAGFIFTLLCVSEKPYNPEKKRSNKKVSAQALAFLIHSPILVKLVILMTLCTAVFQPFNMFWQIYAVNIIEVQELGILWIAMQLMLLVGIMASRFVQPSHQLKALYISVIALCVPFVALYGIGYSLLGLGMFVLHEIGRGSLAPLHRSIVQSSISDESMRASITSTQSTIVLLGACFGLLSCGFVAQSTSIPFTWLVYALVPIATCLFFIIKK